VAAVAFELRRLSMEKQARTLDGENPKRPTTKRSAAYWPGAPVLGAAIPIRANDGKAGRAAVPLDVSNAPTPSGTLTWRR
jgi:hypothetical protein